MDIILVCIYICIYIYEKFWILFDDTYACIYLYIHLVQQNIHKYIGIAGTSITDNETGGTPKIFSPRMKKNPHDKHVRSILTPQLPDLEYQPIPLSLITYENGSSKKAVKPQHKAKYGLKKPDSILFTPGTALGGTIVTPSSGSSSMMKFEPILSGIN
jgi:hypothetical protein